MNQPRNRRAGRAEGEPYLEGMPLPETRKDVKTRTRRRKRAAALFAMLAVFGALVLVGFLVPLATGVSWNTLLFGPPTQASYRADSPNDPEATPSLTEGYDGLVISEIMSANHTAVPDENGKFGDWIELWNNSGHAIDLLDVGLSDDPNDIKFIFPRIILQADERIVIFCDNTNSIKEPLHAKFKLSSYGETVYLFDPHSYLIDSASFPNMAADYAWALLDNGRWVETTDFSPGEVNNQGGHEAYYVSSTVTDGALIINEVMASNQSSIYDEDGERCDWVELRNTTDSPISLDNYALSDRENRPLRWRFPQGATIPAHGYYVVYCSGKNRATDPSAIPHTDFSISAEHDTVVLSDSRGRIVDRVILDNVPEDNSYARGQDGTFAYTPFATPGRANDDTDGADIDMRRRNRTGVIITEVMASNDSVKTVDDTTFTDWIEIRNTSNTEIDLSGYGLSDRIGRPRRWQFPNGTRLQAGACLVILCDGNTAVKDGRLHSSFKIRRGGGETVCLSDPTGFILDRLVLSEIPTNVSYGRTLMASGLFYYDTPSPGQDNVGGFLGYAKMPEFTLAPGMHNLSSDSPYVETTITIPEGTTVYYTLDGSIPTRSSALYNGEIIAMNHTTVIRARAFGDNPLTYASSILTGTYLIETHHTLPVFSVVTDPDELWNETDGMLVFGANGVKEAPGKLPFKNTVYRQFGKIPRPVHVEYYDVDGTQLLNQDAQFSLMGDYSLDMPQKSMKFRAKSVYGAKTFDAALFEDRDFTEYKSFVLRNSGNDCMFSRLADGFQSRLIDAYQAQTTYSEDTIPVIHLAWKPVVVYINGAYWGHMNLRERCDRFFVAQHEGLELSEADQMVILEASGALKYGTDTERRAYRSWRNAMTEKSFKPAVVNGVPNADLQYILDAVDVDNFFEYMALEMFLGNSDIGNLRFYRLHEEGSKWRWILYDVDYGLFNSGFNSPRSYTKTKGMGEQNINNTVFLKLLSVPEYKEKFLRKLADVFTFCTTEKMLSILEPMVEEITPEMTLHWERWGPENDKMVISDVPTTADGAYRYWQQRVEFIRNVIRKRPRKLWAMIKNEFNLTEAQMIEYGFGEQPHFPADANLSQSEIETYGR
ncbi:MAG: lamin tail domain-containing protein [Clostridia bacterium]|nr:lamin tail domain-containing protein [Clostridia bacterium]